MATPGGAHELLKMVVHARAGGTIEIMGLIQGDSIIVMDAFALPVEGTETSAGPHLITGNGVGFKPDILDMDIMEKVLEVKGEDAVKMAQQLALQEGLLVGISSGANTVAAIELAKRPKNKGKLIVEGEIEYVEGDDIEMSDMDDMEDFEGFGDEDDNVKKLYSF
ncbi:hypothetical protein ZWY2020_004956 [Hordeum vulgare]|nr:hypothetical protein ZWY2020_004956 [Hordeum vulgare]